MPTDLAEKNGALASEPNRGVVACDGLVRRLKKGAKRIPASDL